MALIVADRSCYGKASASGSRGEIPSKRVAPRCAARKTSPLTDRSLALSQRDGLTREGTGDHIRGAPVPSRLHTLSNLFINT